MRTKEFVVEPFCKFRKLYGLACFQPFRFFVLLIVLVTSEIFLTSLRPCDCRFRLIRVVKYLLLYILSFFNFEFKWVKCLGYHRRLDFERVWFLTLAKRFLSITLPNDLELIKRLRSKSLTKPKLIIN